MPAMQGGRLSNIAQNSPGTIDEDSVKLRPDEGPRRTDASRGRYKGKGRRRSRRS